MFVRVLIAAVLLVGTAGVWGQAPVTVAVSPAMPAYDLVVTVKPSKDVDTRWKLRVGAGMIVIQNATLKNVLTNVYGVRESQVVGTPKWADTERFDIQAKVLSDDEDFLKHLRGAQRRLVFERLLQEAFGESAHKETREGAVYDLVKVGAGAKLVENPPPATGVKEEIKPGRNGRGNTSVVGTHLDATGVRMGDLCANLARVVDRNVVDKTGLAGFYDVTLDWNDEEGPSLFTAVEEQLGLKMVGSKGPVEVLVVEKASRPKVE